MDDHSVEPQAKSKTPFHKTILFPQLLSALALAIALGGHAFTAANSVSLARLNNVVDGLVFSKSTSQEESSQRDRTLQSLQAEIERNAGVISDLRMQVAALDAFAKDAKAKAQKTEVESKAVKGSSDDAVTVGVSPQFDSAIRARLIQQWKAPTVDRNLMVDEDGLTVMQFSLSREGIIRDVRVTNSSGQPEFDAALVAAAKRVAAIPEVARMTNEHYARVSLFHIAIYPAQFD